MTVEGNPWLLFIEAEANTERLPWQIRRMYRAHGFLKEKRCGACAYFYRTSGNTKDYFKCQVYGETSGAGTDWRKKWMACGLFKEHQE